MPNVRPAVAPVSEGERAQLVVLTADHQSIGQRHRVRVKALQVGARAVRTASDASKQYQYQLAPFAGELSTAMCVDEQYRRHTPIDRGAPVLGFGGAEKALLLQMVFAFSGSVGAGGSRSYQLILFGWNLQSVEIVHSRLHPLAERSVERDGGAWRVTNPLLTPTDATLGFCACAPSKLAHQ